MGQVIVDRLIVNRTITDRVILDWGRNSTSIQYVSVHVKSPFLKVRSPPFILEAINYNQPTPRLSGKWGSN